MCLSALSPIFCLPDGVLISFGYVNNFIKLKVVKLQQIREKHIGCVYGCMKLHLQNLEEKVAIHGSYLQHMPKTGGYGLQDCQSLGRITAYPNHFTCLS